SSRAISACNKQEIAKPIGWRPGLREENQKLERENRDLEVRATQSEKKLAMFENPSKAVIALSEEKQALSEENKGLQAYIAEIENTGIFIGDGGEAELAAEIVAALGKESAALLVSELQKLLQ